LSASFIVVVNPEVFGIEKLPFKFAVLESV